MPQLATVPPEAAAAARSDDGTVLLATFDVPFDSAAASFAVDTAVDSARALIVANFVELPPLPLSAMMGYDTLEYTSELESSLVAPALRAQSLGIAVERIRVRSFRRVEALIEVARERRVRMLVLGPDRSRVSPRLYRKAATAVREELDCLVWISWELPPS